MRKIYIALTMIAFAGCCLASSPDACGAARKKDKKEKADTVKTVESKYDKLFKKETKSADGLIKVHLAGGKVYFELDKKLLGREFLMGSTIKSTSDNKNAVVGSKPLDLKHFCFQMPDTSTVQMRNISTYYVSDDENISAALAAGATSTIDRIFKVKAISPDSSSVVFDATPVFLEHDKSMSPFLSTGAYASSYTRSETFKKDLSYISDVKSFPDNISVTSCMSYTYSMKNAKGTDVYKDKALTAELVRSIILLPEQTYHPRTADPRIGLFFTERARFASETSASRPEYLVNRWRLEPSDTAAFRRGETVEPVKPIVFYIDSNFPEWWKPYIRASVADWSEVFERIGFKNAVIARDYPTPEEDPGFDPDNIKYNCIRYAPVNVRNAMGPSWIDPRSGEIINASVYVYHDVVKLISSWLFVQTAPADPDVRTAVIPREILGDALSYVIRHEVGHCLGLMHNMSASSVIPVESLRDPGFTAKNGTTTSIMDYARWNYVAQPGDKERGVRLTPPKFGSYDYWAIRWAYTPVFDAKDFEEETAITTGWISDSLRTAPFYHYGKQQLYSIFYDPRRQSEDLGDDAVKASEYGIRNLKYVMDNFIDWVSEGDDDYDFRVEILQNIMNQYYRYANHVCANVGGIYVNEVKQGDVEPRFQNIPAAKQKESFEFLFKMWQDAGFLDDSKVLGRLPVAGSPAYAVRRAIQQMILVCPFNAAKVDGVESRQLSADECFAMVFDKVWNPTRKGKKLSEAERSFQTDFVTLYMTSADFKIPSGKATGIYDEDAVTITGHGLEFGEESGPGDIVYSPVAGFEWIPRFVFNNGNITQADIYALIDKARTLMKSRLSSADEEDKAHYNTLLQTINYSLK